MNKPNNNTAAIGPQHTTPKDSEWMHYIMLRGFLAHAAAEKKQ